jgi:hypothetical protein
VIPIQDFKKESEMLLIKVYRDMDGYYRVWINLMPDSIDKHYQLTFLLDKAKKAMMKNLKGIERIKFLIYI